MNAVDLRLYGIIDPVWTGGRPAVDLARAAVAGGCTLIQYRDKSDDVRRMVDSARALKSALAETGVPLLINDRVDVAIASGADGVHLGQTDMHPADARRLLGPSAIIGLTVKTAAQADETFRLPVDYTCIGGVFSTGSKVNEDPPVGLEGFSRIAFRARLASGAPVGAIAGITADNAGSVIAAGADGVAVISAIFMVDDVTAETRRLRAIIDKALEQRRQAQ
ncbi:thiamine phosphate synthase [Microvirga massiliensis]|uniref:thiamine phosphate synthase n=1 Tax=Microvirga massiliensis TaxID=1033741 RepID=UPI00062B63E2|nr:thiamine phosphate synthase [Microvirga massiliensis]